ncbi:hypothetical protein RDI58_003005 [Solanum bulbocastanum]|uniref:Cupin type-1 domain-containing protein n=1 Tax=Solanum bulbocastanum TaxID=147425 RepID=A0AAN8UEH7_SOLBU
MALKYFVLIIAILAVVTSISHASDPCPLQDFCFAVNDSMNAVFVNEKFCKNPMDVTVDDFFRPGLNMAGNTSNQLRSVVTAVNVNNLVGLKTLGISLARIDFAPYGLNPPHTHPRGTEVLALFEVLRLCIITIQEFIYLSLILADHCSIIYKSRLKIIFI